MPRLTVFYLCSLREQEHIVFDIILKSNANAGHFNYNHYKDELKVANFEWNKANSQYLNKVIFATKFKKKIINDLSCGK